MAEPRCRYFRECGGCELQHIDYPLQLENKRKTLSQAVKLDDIGVFSDKPYNYRNRMDFYFSPKGLGLRRKGNPGEIVHIERCEIVDERINGLLNECNHFFRNPEFYQARKGVGVLKLAIIRATSKGTSISFILNEHSARLTESVERIKEFSGKSSAENILISYKSPEEGVSEDDFFVVKGDDRIEEELLGKSFAFSNLGFFQNNTGVAEMMQRKVRDILKDHKNNDTTLLDLYAGVGTFGIINSDLFGKTIIVESFAQSIEAAKENCERNSAAAECIALDAKNLKKLALRGRFVVVADPPRSGMDEETIRELKRISPKAIIYISCNIEQLRRDIQKFEGYAAKSAALFDMFPQTNHIESLVVLLREDS